MSPRSALMSMSATATMGVAHTNVIIHRVDLSACVQKIKSLNQMTIKPVKRSKSQEYLVYHIRDPKMGRFGFLLI